MLKKKVFETLSLFSDSGSDDNTASSTFLRNLNEYICYGFHIHPWSNASTPSSNSIYETLQKLELGLHVWKTVKNITFDYIFQSDFVYRGKISKDLKFSNESRAWWKFPIADSNVFKFGLMVKANDESSIPFFKTVIQISGLQTIFQI